MKKEEDSIKEPLNPNSDEEVGEEDNKIVQEEPTMKGMTEEDKKLGGHPPLQTIFRLSVGPLLSQITNSLFGIITTIWVSKACGDDGLSAVSTMNAFDNIGRAFGFFLAMAASTQISFLYGKGKSKEAGQIIADLIRMSFVCGAITAGILLPILKPCARWFGANETIVQLGFDYMLPLSVFAFNSCLFIASGGCLQGEGRTFLFGMSNVFCLCLNMLALDPLFLFVFKMGIRGASVATVVSEFIPMIVILGLFYAHKFGVKPNLNQLLMKFSPHTFPALKVGFSSLISQLSIFIPSIMVRKYIGLACGDEFSDAMAGFNAAIRIGNLTFSIFQAFSQAFIPAASYAHAAKKYNRYIRLCIHSLWINVVWGTITCIITWTIPREISKMFSTSEGYLNWAEKMVAINNALGPISGIKMISQSILQSLQMGPRATILSFINNFVSLCVLTLILYYTDKNDGARIIWCYPLSHVVSIVMSVFFLWTPLRNLMKEAKEEEARQGMEMHDMDEDEENDIHNNEIIGEKSTDEIEQSDSNTNYSLNEKNETKFTDNITKADEKV